MNTRHQRQRCTIEAVNVRILKYKMEKEDGDRDN